MLRWRWNFAFCMLLQSQLVVPVLCSHSHQFLERAFASSHHLHRFQYIAHKKQSNFTRVEHRTGVNVYAFLFTRSSSGPSFTVAHSPAIVLTHFSVPPCLFISFHWLKFDYKCLPLLSSRRFLFVPCLARFGIKQNMLALISGVDSSSHIVFKRISGPSMANKASLKFNTT